MNDRVPERGVQSCPGRGPRTGWREAPGKVKQGRQGNDPGSGPKRDDAIAQAWS